MSSFALSTAWNASECTDASLLIDEIKQAGFDQIETSGTDLLCREPKRSPSSTKTYLRRLGKLPQLMERKPLLKLNEIIRFLKIYIHAKNQ